MNSMLQTPYTFTTCLLKANTALSGWQKAIQKLLTNMHGVNSFKMAEDGKVLISGKVTPKALVKVLGKAGNKALILWWQFGGSSSNLFLHGDNHNIHDPYGSEYYKGGKKKVVNHSNEREDKVACCTIM